MTTSLRDLEVELFRSAGQFGAATALTLFADAVEQVEVPATSDEARAGAEAMRAAVVAHARAMAAKWQT